MAERQKIIETNRSIRNIKNELESLLEKDIITDESYQAIHTLLPAEAALNSSAATPQPTTKTSTKTTTTAAAPAAASHHTNPAPPSYHQTTAAAPPALPTRTSAAPTKPVVAHARALYAYTASDARDVGFERGDAVLVFEYMNADWWMGRNERTGAEGIFPRTYVETTPAAAPGAAYYGGGDEKAAAAAAAPVAYGGYPVPGAPQQNPYHSSAPPMAMANPNEGGSGEGNNGESKANGMGKKFGKKLGNAAIFGAGATIGSNIVNSIF